MTTPATSLAHAGVLPTLTGVAQPADVVPLAGLVGLPILIGAALVVGAARARHSPMADPATSRVASQPDTQSAAEPDKARWALERVAGPVGVVTAVVMVVAAAVAAATRPSLTVPFLRAIPATVSVDGLAAVMLPTVAVVTAAVLVFALGRGDGEVGAREAGHDGGASRARFVGLMLLFSAAAALTAMARNVPTLLVAWELMGAMSWALIGYRWRHEAPAAAGRTAFVTTRTADLGLYVAAGAALAGGAGMDLAALPAASPGWRHVIAAGILVAALGKAAQLPFSFWLSGAMQGPSPVSALLHSAAMVALGAFLLLRVAPLLAADGWAASAAAWVGAVTAVGLGLVACAQRDIKQLLAASTGAQLGIVVLAAGLGAVSAGLVQLVAHAATKALLFLAAGAWLGMTGTRDLARLRGVARQWPAVGVPATVGVLSLAGVPPLSLWASKDAVVDAVKSSTVAGAPVLYLLGTVAAVLSAMYSALLLAVLWGWGAAAAPVAGLGADSTSRAGVDVEEPRWGSAPVTLERVAPLMVLAVGAAALGVLALPPGAAAVAALLAGPGRTPGPVEASVGALTISGLLAVGVVAVVVRFGLPERQTPREPRLWTRPAGRARPGFGAASRAGEARPTGSLTAVTPGPGGAPATPALLGVLADWLGLERAVHRLVIGLVDRVADALARFDDRVLDAPAREAGRVVAAVADRLGRVDSSVLDAAVSAVAGAVRRWGRQVPRLQTGQLYQYYVQAVVAVAAVLVVAVSFVVVR